jgi:hypothetical protein
MMRQLLLACSLFFLLSVGFEAVGGADTPTPTATLTVNPAVTLNHNRFNPAQGETLAVRGLRPDHEQVTVTVFTHSGQQVTQVWNQPVTTGQEPVWDGRNSAGTLVASGVYSVTITGHHLNKRLRVAVVK